jgi:hypothetical protein
VSVDLVEAKPDISTLGSGITLQGNALRVLRDLGVWEQVRDHGYAFNTLGLRAPDPHGTLLVEMEDVRSGGPDLRATVGLYRPTLATLLLDRAADVGATVRLGTTWTERHGAPVRPRRGDRRRRAALLQLGTLGRRRRPRDHEPPPRRQTFGGRTARPARRGVLARPTIRSGQTAARLAPPHEPLHTMLDTGTDAAAGVQGGFEVRPNEFDDAFQPLHQVAIPHIGLFIGEMWDLDALAHDCADDGVYEFWLTAAPQPVTGAVGAPVNPIAVK